LEKQDGVECELREGEEFSSTKQKPENVGREKFGAKWCEKVRGGGGLPPKWAGGVRKTEIE